MGPYAAVLAFAVSTAGLTQSLEGALRQRFRRSTGTAVAGIEITRRLRPTWNILDAVVLLGLVGFSGFRYMVGTDYPMYLDIYSRLNPTFWRDEIAASNQEIGYTGLALVIKSTFGGLYAMFWVSSAITVTLIYLAIRRRSLNVALAIALYITLGYYVAPFNIIRQGLAVAVLFAADRFLGYNNRRFAILALIAIAFHTSAVIAVAIQVIVHRRRLTARLAAGTTLATLVVFYAVYRIPLVAEALADLNPRYELYLSPRNAGTGTYMLLLTKVALLTYSAYLGREKEFARHQVYLMIGIAFVVLGIVSVPLGRMEYFFSIFVVLLIPNQLARRKGASVHTVILLVLGCVYFWYFLHSFSSLVPYRTYL